MSALTRHYVDTKVKNRRIMMFAKSNDPDSKQAKEILEEYVLSKGKLKPKKISTKLSYNYLRHI